MTPSKEIIEEVICRVVANREMAVLRQLKDSSAFDVGRFAQLIADELEGYCWQCGDLTCAGLCMWDE